MSERLKYEQIAVREFKNTIPPHLLEKLPESERWIIETMSKLESQSDWLLEIGVQGNRDIVDIGRRLEGVDEWRRAADKRLEGVVSQSDITRYDYLLADSGYSA